MDNFTANRCPTVSLSEKTNHYQLYKRKLLLDLKKVYQFTPDTCQLFAYSMHHSCVKEVSLYYRHYLYIILDLDFSLNVNSFYIRSSGVHFMRPATRQTLGEIPLPNFFKNLWFKNVVFFWSITYLDEFYHWHDIFISAALSICNYTKFTSLIISYIVLFLMNTLKQDTSKHWRAWKQIYS